MRPSIIFSASLLAYSQSAVAFPNPMSYTASDFKRVAEQLEAREVRDGQVGKVITIPDPPADTGLKQIPDAAHPFIAPGPDDIRGPCPALNTMANHGYIPRSGIVSYEDIVSGAMEAFNQEHDLVAFQTGFGMLARGNAFIDLISIGGPSPKVPALPGQIDGPLALGLATHGRFEGDHSSTRMDAALGDNKDFQDSLYDELLLYTGLFGEDHPVYGNHSVATVTTFAEYKWARFQEDQKANPKLELHAGREFFAYGEVSFALAFFANGTEEKLTVPVMGSFFRNQTFPPNFWRRHNPGSFAIVQPNSTAILSAHFVPPGANDASGNYVPDAGITADNFVCSAYENLAGDNLANTLVNTTGILKQNVNTLVAAMFKPFHDANCTTMVQPRGPAGV